MSHQPKHCYEFGPFHVEAEERLLARDGAVIPLTPKAFDLLLVLVAQPGHLLTKEELMQALWPDATVEETNLAWNISHVRKALGESGDGANGARYIETVPRRGYRFVGEVREVAQSNGQPRRAPSPQLPTTSAASLAPATTAPTLPLTLPAHAAATFRFPRERLLWLAISLLLALTALLLYLRRPSPESQLTRFAIPLPPGTITHAAFAPALALSPAGRQLVISALSGAKRQLWLRPLDSLATQPLAGTEGAMFPFWSPDSQQLAFGSARNAPPNVFVKSLAGNAPEARLLESRFQCDPSSWTPDGKAVIFTMVDPQTRRDIWLVPVAGERKPQPLLQTKANEQGGRVSPNGNWLAYNSDESGSNEIYVTQFPPRARSWRISTHGGANAFWRGDGRELFFLANNKLMAVSVRGGAELQVGTPHPLFDLEGIWYEPSQDGQRFLTFVVTEKAPAPPIHVVLNWMAEIKP